MTLQPRVLVLLCGLIPTLVAAALCLYRPPFLSRAEYTVYDVLVRSAGTRPPAGRIVIVDVDDRSLASIGQWPWRRDVVGRLIAGLRGLGASTIALDLIFAEPDRYQETGAGTDAALAQTLRAGRVIVGYALTFDGAAHGSGACVSHPLGLAIVHRGLERAEGPFFRATGAICSLSLLTEAAGASGFLNAAPDPDGVLRRAPLLMEFNGRVYPGLALAAVAAATATRDVALRVANVNTSSLVLDSRVVPLDGKGNLLLRYRGRKRTFPYVSAADVLGARADPASFKDALVFVGTTALGTREVVATPLDTLFAGVEVQATLADNLLQQDFIGRPEHGVVIEAWAVVLLGAIATFMVGRVGLARGMLAAAGCLAAAWVAGVTLMAGNGALISPLYPSLGVIGALASMTVASFATERRRADSAGQQTVTSKQLMVQTLLSLTEVRDAETGRHSRRTQQYARILAGQLSTHPDFRAYLTPERVDLLSTLAPLHDIGKVGIPDRLLQKPGTFTPDELAEMRRHPEYGLDVIVNAERAVGVHDDVTLAMVKEIVHTHHEKWDGTGYPQGLQGVDIPIAGRVMAVVDVFDALTSRRLYQAPLSSDEAVAFIVKGRGTHFDPAVVDAFVSVSGEMSSLRPEQ